MSRASYRIEIPCPYEGRPKHRWDWRETHHKAPDGSFVLDRRCRRCGIWFVDAIEHKS